MKILHYFLGFPPYRSGGLTVFAMDLMCKQTENGDEVYALWPGKMCHNRKKLSIKKSQGYKSIKSYELVNPLPVSIDEGVGSPRLFMQPCDKRIYEEFLDEIQPEVIHIHTIMGIHREFFECANEKNIHIIFTTHDYFGICFRTNLFFDGHACNPDVCIHDCAVCNANAISMNKIKIIQSPLYRKMKNTFMVKMLRKRHREKFYSENNSDVEPIAPDEEYKELRDYYKDILSYVTVFHFNSSVAENIYKNFLGNVNGKVVTITNHRIRDNRRERNFCRNNLTIAYLAKPKNEKGYSILIKALDILWEKKKNFRLNLYCNVPEIKLYMNVREDGFLEDEFQNIMDDIDVMVVPSIWYETFGFTALEAISCGIPVIVTDRVGAKDVISDGGIVIPADDVNQLVKAIEEMTPDSLNRYNKNIINNAKIKKLDEMVEEIYELYRY